MTPRVVILISGGGTNMETLICNSESIPIDIVGVISNKAHALGIAKAQHHGVKCHIAQTMDEIKCILDEMKPDLVCLAGFMRILPSTITKKYIIMNIHPALLPMYPGLHAQEKAINDKATHSGCTVHFVDSGVDTGPIILQRVVKVLSDDTSEILADRILQEEHIAYTDAVRLYAQKCIKYKPKECIIVH